MNSNKLEKVKFESLRVNMFQTKSVNFPVTINNILHSFW